jgi:hypothetical protein
MTRKRPGKPEGWTAPPSVVRDIRTKIEAQVFGDASTRNRSHSEADLRAVLGDSATRQKLARDMAGDDRQAYRNALQRLRRYASGERGKKVPDDVRSRIVGQARAAARADALNKLRTGRRPRITMVTDATVSASSRTNFGPGYAGPGGGASVDPEALAEALERGDTWAVMAMAYGDYWPGSEDVSINFDDVRDVEIDWGE